MPPESCQGYFFSNPDRLTSASVFSIRSALSAAECKKICAAYDIPVPRDGIATSADKAAGLAARSRIEQLTADVEVGMIYDGRVARLMDFGAFVNILPGKDGLVHISQISEERVENVSDKLSEGDIVKVKVLEVDRQGRIRLSMKAVGQD